MLSASRGGLGLGSLVGGLLLLSFGLNGCAFTSIGIDQSSYRSQIDFGKPRTVKVCAVLDNEVTQENAQDTLVKYWNDGEANKYNLTLDIVSYSQKDRPLSEYFSWDIANDVAKMPIPPQCDRVMYFIGRNFADVLWSIPEIVGAPEVLGWVDDATMTRGFVIAQYGSLNQVLMGAWFSPAQVARHETYHLLGCGHDLTMHACYEKIRNAKALEAALESAGCYDKAGLQPFFPAFPNAGSLGLLTRDQVNLVPSAAENDRLKDLANCAARAALPVDKRGETDMARLNDWLSTQPTVPMQVRMATK
jgi:hypothetical protein